MTLNKQLTIGGVLLLAGGLLLGTVAVTALNSSGRGANAPLIVRSSPAAVVQESAPQAGEVSTASAAAQPSTLIANPKSTLFLYGVVDYDNSETLAGEITKLNQESNDSPIVLVIDSPGGAVFGGAKVTAAIQGSRRPVYTVCSGLCASMGAIIHSYGHKRLVTRKSTLMFHNASGGLSGEVPQMKVRLTYIENFVNKMSTNVAQRAGITFAQYDTLIAHEFWIEGEDAVSRRFADEVINLDLSKTSASSQSGFGLKTNQTSNVGDNTDLLKFIHTFGM